MRTLLAIFTAALGTASATASVAQDDRLADWMSKAEQFGGNIAIQPPTERVGAASASILTEVGAHNHDADTLLFPPLKGVQTASFLSGEENGGWVETDTAFEHKPSGMICPKLLKFNTEDEVGMTAELDSVRLYKADGSDTGCNFVATDGSLVLTLFASRWPRVSLEDHFATAVRLMSNTLPLDSPTGIVVVNLATPADAVPRSKTLAQGYLSKPLSNGSVAFTGLWLAKVGDWHVKARSTFVPSDDTGLMVGSAWEHAQTVVNVQVGSTPEQLVERTVPGMTGIQMQQVRFGLH